MSTTPEQINLWRSVPSEHQRLEFKEAKTQFDFRTLCKYCVALANEGGGQLLFGIADKPPRPVVGSAAANDPIGTAEKLFQTLGFRVDVEAVNHPDGRVVVFHIPSRPRGTAYHLSGSYFMRAGEELQPMSEDLLRRIFAEGEPDWLEEFSRTGLDAAQVVELLDTQGFFELLKLPYPAEQPGVLDRLQQERLVDLVAGSYSIRRLGALLLAKKLQDFPDVSRKVARVVVYAASSKLDTKLDHAATKGYAVGFQELVRFIMAQLPQNEVIQDALRNERLADLMRRFAICEEKGSGVDKVIQAIEAHQLPAPDFRAGFKRFSAVLFAPRPFDDMDRSDRIRACYQHCCLCYVLNRKMTNQSLRERFKLPEGKMANISQALSATLDAGIIKIANPAQSAPRYRSYLPSWA